MSELRTNRIVPRDGLVSGANGGVIQIAVTQKSNVFTWSSNGDVAITGMSVSITPTRSDSKVLIQVQIGASGVGNDAFPIFWQLYKNGSVISNAQGDDDGGASDPVGCASYTKNALYYSGTSTSFSFLDSPGAGTHEYHLQFSHSSGGNQTFYFNRTPVDTNSSGFPRTISLIRCSEVAA